MKVFVIGNIGAGKSTVSKFLAKNLNADVIDLDKLGHRALDANKSEVEQVFGRFNSRDELLKLVGSDIAKLKDILYPYIYDEMLKAFKDTKNIVVEQSVYDKKFLEHADFVVYVQSNYENRLNRKGKETFTKLDELQQKDLEKYADFAVTNDSTIEELEKKCDDLAAQLLKKYVC